MDGEMRMDRDTSRPTQTPVTLRWFSRVTIRRSQREEAIILISQQVINQMDDKIQLFNLKSKILYSFCAKIGFCNWLKDKQNAMCSINFALI